MSDWINQIVEIEKVVKHPNADNLSIASVMGDYPIVVRTGDFNVGDLAGYISLESIVPDTDQFYFLCPKAYEKYEDEAGQIQQRVVGPKYPIGSVPEKYRRIKAKRFLGIYSQGLLIPCPPGMVKGDSIVDLLGLKKFVEEEEDNLPNAKFRRADTESPPKGWAIPYYDIDGIRKYVECLLPNEEIVLTEKIHGSNAAFCYDGEKLWTKSRNFYKKRDEDDMWWDIALRYDLESKLMNYPNVVLFGEIYGQVKGFRYDCVLAGGEMRPRVRFFDALDTKTMRYLNYDAFVVMVESLNLDRAPELYRGPWKGKEEMYPYAEGLTTLGGKHIREGWVLKTTIERYEPRLDKRMIVKLVGEGYNLQK
jgi:RNA ligase (TIGR02306 family)